MWISWWQSLFGFDSSSSMSFPNSNLPSSFLLRQTPFMLVPVLRRCACDISSCPRAVIACIDLHYPLCCLFCFNVTIAITECPGLFLWCRGLLQYSTYVTAPWQWHSETRCVFCVWYNATYPKKYSSPQSLQYIALRFQITVITSDWRLFIITPSKQPV